MIITGMPRCDRDKTLWPLDGSQSTDWRTCSTFSLTRVREWIWRMPNFQNGLFRTWNLTARPVYSAPARKFRLGITVGIFQSFEVGWMIPFEWITKHVFTFNTKRESWVRRQGAGRAEQANDNEPELISYLDILLDRESKNIASLRLRRQYFVWNSRPI